MKPYMFDKILPEKKPFRAWCAICGEITEGSYCYICDPEKFIERRENEKDQTPESSR